MITRRDFAMRLGMLAAGPAVLNEFALAQRAAVAGSAPPGTVWINANENPDGPCPAAVEAMRGVLTESGRYHYQEFRDFYATVARSEQLDARQVLVGAGSSEVLHMAIEAFTSPSRPLITTEPTYEYPTELARAKGAPVVLVPLTSTYAADVKRLVEEAGKAKGGLIYLCNPNNPTASITTKKDVAWLVDNLPAGAILLADEAYIHFSDSPELESCLTYVRQSKNVIVARTFSKIYGMAGLRVGFGCAKPELIAKMAPFRTNVISIVSARATLAALGEAATLVPQRRAKVGAIRDELCAWLRDKNLRYIQPYANFMMIDVKQDVRGFIPKMLAKGIAIGRPFPPYATMARVSIGTAQEMVKFREAFWQVYQA